MAQEKATNLVSTLKTRLYFAFERGNVFGDDAPLLVAESDHFGIGVEAPRANLHISGNFGVIFAGEFFGITDETLAEKDDKGKKILPKLVEEGPGTRLIWDPSRAALRAGHISQASGLGGQEWNTDNVGKFSVAFGRNNIASGNFSSVLGGTNNQAGGAYSTILGGENNRAMGDFSLASGRNAWALNHGSFVWNDNSRKTFISRTENQFVINASSRSRYQYKPNHRRGYSHCSCRKPRSPNR